MTRIRQPLSDDEMYAWWRARLSGENVPIHMNEPMPGFYKTRLVRGGPFVGGHIWMEQDVDEAGELLGAPKLRCRIDGRECDPADRWTWLAGRPVSEEEYASLLASRMAPPDVPVAATPGVERAVDWATMKPPF